MRQAAAVAFVAAASAFGHHSLHGTYLLDRQITIEGKVNNFLLRNPHSFLEVEAPDEGGRMQEWLIEWGNAAALAVRGIRRDTINPGDEVTITMSPGRNAADHRGVLRTLRRNSDGLEWGTKPGEELQEWGMRAK